MDQILLVSLGQALVKALDAEGFHARLAMWVHDPDTDEWKLWIVPPKGIVDKHTFYRKVSETASKNRLEVGGIDAGDTRMVLDTHPAMRGVGRYLKLPGLGSVIFRGNRFDDFYLPEGIILRSDLEQGSGAAAS